MGILAKKEGKVTELSAEMVELYGHMIASMNKVKALEAAGKPAKDERVRFSRLEIKVNATWPKMTREEQIASVNELVKKDLMAPLTAEVLTMYEGSRIDMDPPAEPCIRIGPHA